VNFFLKVKKNKFNVSTNVAAQQFYHDFINREIKMQQLKLTNYSEEKLQNWRNIFFISDESNKCDLHERSAQKLIKCKIKI
jgi:hypothetical protein